MVLNIRDVSSPPQDFTTFTDRSRIRTDEGKFTTVIELGELSSSHTGLDYQPMNDV